MPVAVSIELLRSSQVCPGAKAGNSGDVGAHGGVAGHAVADGLEDRPEGAGATGVGRRVDGPLGDAHEGRQRRRLAFPEEHGEAAGERTGDRDAGAVDLGRGGDAGVAQLRGDRLVADGHARAWRRRRRCRPPGSRAATSRRSWVGSGRPNWVTVSTRPLRVRWRTLAPFVPTGPVASTVSPSGVSSQAGVVTITWSPAATALRSVPAGEVRVIERGRIHERIGAAGLVVGNREQRLAAAELAAAPGEGRALLADPGRSGPPAGCREAPGGPPSRRRRGPGGRIAARW